MRRVLNRLFMAVAFFLVAAVAVAADQATIKKNVDDMVNAINGGRSATSYAADAYSPYAFIIESDGRLIVHPYLKGEYLQEKAEPVYNALRQATPEGTWVTYFWKGQQKQTYVRKTDTNLIVGSGL